jgi:hypothetical protein
MELLMRIGIDVSEYVVILENESTVQNKETILIKDSNHLTSELTETEIRPTVIQVSGEDENLKRPEMAMSNEQLNVMTPSMGKWTLNTTKIRKMIQKRRAVSDQIGELHVAGKSDDDDSDMIDWSRLPSDSEDDDDDDENNERPQGENGVDPQTEPASNSPSESLMHLIAMKENRKSQVYITGTEGVEKFEVSTLGELKDAIRERWNVEDWQYHIHPDFVEERE